MIEAGTATKFFPNLALGQLSVAPPRSLDPDAGGPFVWRDTQNFMQRNGRLQRRAGFQAQASQPTAATPTGGALQKGELPLIIFADTLGSSDFQVLITSMQILVYPNSTTGWVAATPRYTTGTITATNGSASVTGAGTLWVTRGITANQYMLIDSTWYKISAVTGEGAITLASNYTGATGGGKSYIITRNWQMHTDTSAGGFSSLAASNADVSATIYNGDLYVAGTYLGAADGTARCAVIKVADIYGAASPTTYLTGNFAYVAGLDTIPGLTRIAGIQALQDGRIVIGANNNSVAYSSHLKTAVWTTSPGGQTALSMSNGRLSTIGLWGNTVTAHYPSGVVLGTPTGQSDPPLRWQRSTATKGCDTPRTLRSLGKLEIFMTSDNDICSFDGAEVKSLGNGEIRYRLTATANDAGYSFHASVDPERMEYTLYQAGSPSSVAWLYQFDTDSWWPMNYPGSLWAAFGANHPAAATPSSRILGGFSTVNYATGAIYPELLYQADERNATESVSFPTILPPLFYVETDDLDFGEPFLFKTAQYLSIWLTPRAVINSPTSPESFTVSVSRDGGVTYTDILAPTLTLGSNTVYSVPLQTHFDPLTPGAGDVLRFKLRFGLNSPYNVTPALERMHITVGLGGDIRKVSL